MGNKEETNKKTETVYFTFLATLSFYLVLVLMFDMIMCWKFCTRA